MSTQNKWVVALLLASVVLAIALRYWLHPPLHLQAAELLPAPKPMARYGFTVEGNRVNLDLFKGRWVLLFLGYTSCADICPLELQTLAKMLKQFADAGEEKPPLVLFVSLDPERDKPSALQEYTTFFHEQMMGVTGSNQELAALTGALGATYNRTFTHDGKDFLVTAGADMPADAGEHYVVNHTPRVFILDAQTRYIGSFAPPHDASVLYSDMKQLIHH